jgi:hypothetical protein
MVKKETQKHERQMLTASLTNYRVPSQGVTLEEKAQPPTLQTEPGEDKVEKIFLLMERARPCIAKYVCLGLAIINYFWPHETFTTFLLIGIATDMLSVRDAIELLFQWKDRVIAKRVRRKKSFDKE